MKPLFLPSNPPARPVCAGGLDLLLDHLVVLTQVFLGENAVAQETLLRGQPAKEARLILCDPVIQDDLYRVLPVIGLSASESQDLGRRFSDLGLNAWCARRGSGSNLATSSATVRVMTDLITAASKCTLI